MNNPVFKGDTAACIQHLAKATAGDLEKRRIIASFVGVGDATVYRWFKETMRPVGEPLLRLRFYLEHLGYEVAELESLSSPVRDIARLGAFQVVPLSQIVQKSGYLSKEPLLAAFRGTTGVSEEKLQAFASIANAHSAQLREKQRTTPKVEIEGQLSPRQSAPSFPIGTIQASAVGGGRPPAPRDREIMITSLAYLVRAMLPLVEAVASDDFTPEERALLRKLAGGENGRDNVFTLSNRIYRLCGERTRKMHTNSN